MSWFRNLIVYRLAAKHWTAAYLAEQLATHQFQPCGNLDLQSTGFVPPIAGGPLAYPIAGGHIFLALCVERKNLPKQVIDRVVEDRCNELAEQQGFKPGRKQRREIREQVIDDLLPRAFSTRSVTRIWLDPADGWLVVDTPRNGAADDAFRCMLKALESMPVTVLRPNIPPHRAMTHWLAADEAPHNFTVDQDTELQAHGDTRATVRYIRHTLEVDDLRRHIQRGKQCTQLALTWNDRISFVLTDGLVLKRVTPLDVLKQSHAADVEMNADGDLFLMASEFRGLLDDLVHALGGEEGAA